MKDTIPRQQTANGCLQYYSRGEGFATVQVERVPASATACSRGGHRQSPSPCLYDERGRCRQGVQAARRTLQARVDTKHGTLPSPSSRR